MVHMHFRRFLCCCALAAMPALAAEIMVFEQIVAKVNGDIITRGELERQRAQLEQSVRADRNMAPARARELVEERGKTILRDQIDQLLLVQKGKELSINCSPEITRQIADIQKQSPCGADNDCFQRWVREQAGVPFEDFKSQMTNQCLTQRVVRQEVGGKINITREEMTTYYNEHKTEFVRKEEVFLREITLITEGKTPEQAAAIEKKAKALVERARKGEKFHDMAKDNSESDTAKQYGELGWWKKGELNPQIETIAFREKKGYVSDPIKTDRGWIIIKVEERHDEGQAGLEDVENEIMEKLYMPRMEPRVREYLTKLRQDAFLEIREGYLDAGAAPGKLTGWTDVAQLRPETTTKAEVIASQTKKLLWLIPMGKKGPAAAAEPEAARPPVAAPPSQ